jgi:hypothetical protein
MSPALLSFLFVLAAFGALGVIVLSVYLYEKYLSDHMKGWVSFILFIAIIFLMAWIYGYYLIINR